MVVGLAGAELSPNVQAVTAAWAPPVASVVVPAHNAERTIGRCLTALANQTVPRASYEVLVVDDGSTDRTAAVAAEHGAVVLTHPTRSGAGAARNTGAAQARGHLLLFIDADCEATPAWVEEMLRPFTETSVCAVYGAYRTRQTSLIAQFAQAEFEERYTRLTQRESIDFLATHAAAFRREVFARSDGFRRDLLGNEDVEIAYRLSRQGFRLAFAAQAAVYHEHPSTLARYLATKMSRGYWRTIVYARHPQKAIYDSYTPPWLKLQVAGLLAVAGTGVAAALRPQLGPAVAILAALTLASTFPFTRFVFRRRPRLLVVTPWLSLARSAALGLGVAAGLAAVAAGWLSARPGPIARTRHGSDASAG